MTDSFAEHASRMEMYDPDLVLGQLAWYSIPDLLVDHGQIVAAMEANGLEKYRLPRVPRSVDVFKRACTAAERKRIGTGVDGQFANYMIRNVGMDADTIWRRIVREIVDTDGRTLEYCETAELEFDRTKGVIHWKACSTTGSLADHVDKNVAIPQTGLMIEEIQAYFKQQNNALTGHSIRELVRMIFESLYATCVRPSGGIYFIREQYAEPLLALEQMVNSLGDCNLTTLPLLDDRKRREMLKKAFEDESVEEIDRVLALINDITVNNKGITSDRYAQIAGSYRQQVAKAREYSDLLDDALTMTSSRLELYEAAVIGLMERVQ